jgi:ribosomal protein S12 methylthiotransferase accessory factor
VDFIDTIDGDAELHHAAASIANSHPRWEADVRLAGGGSGHTREDALMAALGEGLERYLASVHSRGRDEIRCETDLPGDALPAASFAQFSQQQREARHDHAAFPYQPATPHTPLRWLSGNRLGGDFPRGDTPCCVPAFAVYLPYQTEVGEPLVAPGLSTGLSCGGCVDAAILGGLYEVIERDALALTWLAGMTPPAIATDWLVAKAGDLLPPSDRTAAYDLTSDVGVPVVLVVCRGEGPTGPILSAGSACHLDARRAVRKAAMEASQGRVFVRRLLESEPPWQPAADFSNVSDFSLHARLYSVRPELANEALRFLDGNPCPSRLPQSNVEASPAVARDLRHVVDRLLKTGHEGASIDLTAGWAAALDLHVVKVVVPTLMPLHGHHLLPYLGHARLACRGTAMPQSIIRHEHPIWPYPHPFP